MKVPVLIPLLTGVMCSFGLPAAAGQQPSERPTAKPPLVTTRMQAFRLQDALTELSRSTGVRMAAAPEVAELKVTILVKDLPLATVQARIAEAFHLTWKHQDADKTQQASDLLYRSAHDVEVEQKLQNRGETAFRKGIEAVVASLTLSPEDRARLLQQNKQLASLTPSKGNFQPIVALFSHLTPQQRTRIMDGEKLEFSAEKPPAELAPYITPTIDALRNADKDTAHAYIYAQGGKRFTFERIGEGAESRIDVTFSVHDEKGTARFGYPIRDVMPTEVYPEFYSPDHTGADYADARVPIDVPTKLTAESLEALLVKVADTMHVNVIGESYFEGVPTHGEATPVYFYSVSAGPVTTQTAFDSIMPRDTWWKTGSVYLFQRHLWWRARRADVANSTQLHLMEVLGHKALSFDDGVEVCKTLSAEQWQWLVPRYIHTYVRLQPMQSALRFYGLLSVAHRAKLFRDDGMEASGLEAEDQKRLNLWINELSNEVMEGVQNRPGRVRIMAIRPSRDAQFGAVIFRAVFQAKDGTTTLLREQRVQVTDPLEHYVTSEDPQP